MGTWLPNWTFSIEKNEFMELCNAGLYAHLERALQETKPGTVGDFTFYHDEHWFALQQACKQACISGLDFVSALLVVLEHHDVKPRIDALDEFLRLVETAIANRQRGPIDELLGCIDPDVEWPALERAFRESTVLIKISPSCDAGYGVYYAFFSFVRTLRAVMQSCADQKRPFVWFRHPV